jgi:putative FmdB family regulatory protein
MPIYDYRCAECGAEFERLVRGTAIAAVACPRCSATKVERRMSLTARPAGGARGPDLSRLGPPPGGCCGGACGSHRH